MGALVRKSSPELVRPSSVAVGGNMVKLTPYDEIFVGARNTALLVFSDPTPKATERIKAALSQALVHYHLIAGRLVRAGDNGSDGNYLACTSEGVLFVAATAPSSTVEEIKYLNSSMPTTTLLDDLALYYPAEGCGRTDALLLVQVTEFSCGGFVVGITSSHAVADGVGMGLFMQAVGEFARGLPSPSVVPVACDDSLNVLPPIMLAVRRVFESLERCHDLDLLDITVSADTISRVRDVASSASRRCTVFEAVAALLWKCRTRAIMSDPEAPTALSISMDARGYVGAPPGYYRNCTMVQLAVAKSGAVADGPIGDLVKLIQHAKDKVPQMMQVQSLDVERQNLQGYNLCVVTYWRHLGFADTDFGGGKPATVLSYRQNRGGLPSNIITTNGKDGGCNVLSRTVKQQHAHAFLHELASITT
ncbi:unnamed protein product [Alopecurus aequalis]